MKIVMVLSTHGMGDSNTDADNQRYADAVEEAIIAEYPEAEVSVELTSHVSSGACWVSNDDDEILENVNTIAQRVWDKADY